MKVHAMLTMQRTVGILQIVEHLGNTIDFPDMRKVSRGEVLRVMIDRMPESVQDGVILFFSAEPEYIS